MEDLYQTDSVFWTLPRELRDKIYAEAYTSREPCQISLKHSVSPKDALNQLLVSRRCNEEATEVFLKVKQFKFDDTSDLDRVLNVHTERGDYVDYTCKTLPQAQTAGDQSLPSCFNKRVTSKRLDNEEITQDEHLKMDWTAQLCALRGLDHFDIKEWSYCYAEKWRGATNDDAPTDEQLERWTLNVKNYEALIKRHVTQPLEK